MIMQNLAFYKYLIRNIQWQYFHISVITSCHCVPISALFTTTNIAISAFKFKQSREPTHPRTMQETCV